MLTTVKGLVLREKAYGENDKILDILTDSLGLITVSAKGVKKANAKNAGVSQMFAYATFCLSESKGRYILNSAEPIRIFYDIRLDVEKFALASYFCELLLYTSTFDQQSGEVLRLMLNTLHFLEDNRHEMGLLKAIFELRLMSEIGHVPNLIGCCECLSYSEPQMQFDLKGGKIYCERCCGARDLRTFEVIDETLLHAIRYIALTDMERLFGFRLSQDYLEMLMNITERYVRLQLDKRFATLDFYKTITNGNNYE